MKKLFALLAAVLALSVAAFSADAAFTEAAKKASAGADLVFVWGSDVHYQPQDNHGVSREMMEEFVSAAHETGAAFAAITGDLFHGHFDKDTGLGNLAELCTFFEDCRVPVMFTQGNHDDNRYYVYKTRNPDDTFDMGQVINKEDIYRIVLKGREKDFVTDPKNPYGGWYYKDFTKAKIRVIMLNCIDMPHIPDYPVNRFKYYGGYSSDQLNWLAGKALRFSKKGWGVIVMTHIDYASQAIGNWAMPINSEIVEGLLQAFAKQEAGTFYSFEEGMEAKVKYNFRHNSSHEYIAAFAGHKHKNLSESVNGVPHVLISNFFRDQEGGFDLVAIDRKKRLVTTVRCQRGAAAPGLDRVFAY
ncbi:MAG: metallophosphoesterase [Abditibacteriota bacterium]|nr:metallophosphoesterase [Abditibacteriota bacterium]